MMYFLIIYLVATRFFILGMYVGDSFNRHLEIIDYKNYFLACVIFEICVIVSIYRCYIKKYLYKKK